MNYRVTTTRVRVMFALIVILAIFAGLVIWPQVPGFVPGNAWFNKFKVQLGLDLQGGTQLIYQADVAAVDPAERDERVEALRNVIERRINAYGVSEPLVQTNTSGENFRIIVELAGVQNVEEAIAIIDKTPLLEFKTEGEPVAVDQAQIDEVKAKAQGILDRALAGEDFAALASQYSEDPGSAATGGDLGWVVAGDFVPEFDKAIFEDLKDGEITPQLVESDFGWHIIKKIEERLNDQGEREVHSAHILLQAPQSGQPTWVETGLSGKDVAKAQLAFTPNTQEPIVLLNFNDNGKEVFAKLTEDNVGKSIGIFLDGGLISNPIVQEPIKDGTAQISGSFTVTTAKELVKNLNLGALPVNIDLVGQKTVGATLGDRSVQQSLFAGIVGLLAAALFTLIVYRLLGLLAVLALVVYAAVTLAIYELLPVTMTLAGVTGFILSIGMAVDANILIFERTKEELREGKSLNTAIENGFVRAWSSIRDSNVSSIITCFVLAWFGTSIIKGFAITLAIGIFVSMFSAITVTRTFVRLAVNKRLENKLFLFGVKKK